MKKFFVAAVLLAATGPVTAASAAFSVTPVGELDGAPSLISALGFSNPTNVDYVGATGQAGLFSNLTILGAQGTSMSLAGGIMMTSGSVVDLPALSDTGWYSNVTEGDPGSKAIKKIIPSTGSSRGGAGSHDANELAFRFDAPVNGSNAKATAMTVRFVYASEEFPEWSGTIFSDGFAFYMKNSASISGSGLGDNYATFPTGEPVSLLTTAVNSNLLPNGDYGNDGFGAAQFGAPHIATLPYDGFTRVLEFTVPLDPEDNRVTIGISDTGDQVYDSAVFIAPIEFHFGTAPPVGARLAAQSLAYVPMPVPEPNEWIMLLAGLGLVTWGVRRRSA